MKQETQLKDLMTTIRTIALLAILISIAGYLTHKKGALLLGIAGLILLLSRRKHSNGAYNNFKTSLEKWKTILLSALFDALFFVSMGIIALLYSIVINKFTDKLAAASDFSREAIFNSELLLQNTALLKQLTILFGVGVTTFLVLSLLVYSFSRLLLWTTITGQKPSKKSYKSYLGFTAIWWLIWSPAWIIMAFVVSKSPATMPIFRGLFYLTLYFTLMAQIFFAKHNKIGFCIGHGIGLGISKIPALLVPLSTAFVFYAAASQILMLTRFVPGKMFILVNIVFVIIYIAWLRNYLYPVVSELHD